MAVSLIAQPHPKPKKHFALLSDPKRPPYPIPLTDWQEQDSPWTYYKGYLCPVGVEIRDKKEMEALFSRGFFGKGSLSKSAPTYNRALPEGELRKMSRRKFDRHWKASMLEVASSGGQSCTNLNMEDVIVVDEVSEDQDGVVLKDPCPEAEVLLLSFQEAFFLSYALGCLLVLHEDNYLSLEEMWSKFCEFSHGRNFPISYAAYHHFRSKGWVVKSGLKFGANYILYKDGPPFNHASYAVVLQPVSGETLQNCNGARTMTWQQLFGLNRVNLHAGKEVMLCYVLCPEKLTESDYQRPQVIKELKIQEVQIRRWVAAEERIANEEENDCRT